MATEAQIQTDIKAYLEYKGYFVFKVHQQSKYCHKGISDLIAVKDGVSYFVEVKTAKGKLSSDQLKFMDDVTSHGAKYIVARNMDDVRCLA